MKARVFKYARLSFLLLAVTLLNAHMIIPHDHHQSDSDSCQQGSFPSSKQESSHHSGLPLHCHAFNDLAAEKILLLVLKKYFHSGFSKIIWFPDYGVNELHISLFAIHGPRKPLPDIYTPDFSPLRGPPSLN